MHGLVDACVTPWPMHLAAPVPALPVRDGLGVACVTHRPRADAAQIVVLSHQMIGSNQPVRRGRLLLSRWHEWTARVWLRCTCNAATRGAVCAHVATAVVQPPCDTHSGGCVSVPPGSVVWP